MVASETKSAEGGEADGEQYVLARTGPPCPGTVNFQPISLTYKSEEIF
jgi:hypothetical protein